MKILVVGAGATGGYFGARLVQAQREVTFLLRPSRAAVVREHGLRLLGQGDDEVVNVNVATADQIASTYDVVLLGVKNGALTSAIDDMAPAIGPTTMIVPFLNGMRHMDELTTRFGTRCVLGGVVKVSTTLNERGDIVQLTPWAGLVTGSQQSDQSADFDELADVLDVAGFDFALSEQIMSEMWDKWIFIAVLGALTCLLRGTVGEIEAAPGGHDLGRVLLDEAIRAAAACGHETSSEVAEFIAGVVTQPGSSMASSMFRDVIDGHVAESDAILADLIQRGRNHGVDTPLLDLATTQLSIHNDRLRTR